MDTPPNYLIEVRLTTDSNLGRLIGLLVDSSEPFPERERTQTPEEFVRESCVTPNDVRDRANVPRIHYIDCKGVDGRDHLAFRHPAGARCAACDELDRAEQIVAIESSSIDEAIEADRLAEAKREQLLADELMGALSGVEPDQPDELTRVIHETVAPFSDVVAQVKAERVEHAPPMPKGVRIDPESLPSTPKLPKASPTKTEPASDIPEGWLQPSSYAAKHGVKLQTVYNRVTRGTYVSKKIRGSIYIAPPED